MFNIFNWTKAEAITLPIALIITIMFAVVICLITKKKNTTIKKIPLMVISIILLVLEIIKQIYNIVIGYNTWYIPLHFCSLFMYFFPFVCFTNGRFMQYGQTMTLVVTTFFLIIFYTNPISVIGHSCINIFANFSNFHTFFYHHLAILFYLIMIGSKLYNPNKEDYLYACLGIFQYGAIALPVAYGTWTNFCYLIFNQINILEKIRLQAGQFIYTLILLLIGVLGSCLIISIYHGIYKIFDKSTKDEFNIIMKILKEK